ncbi:RusA family crossover junction endodeoxyribonuclease [Enterococcus faecalis]|nr:MULTISPECIES: RusA family crossover junction endodeoxyribonuclease [Enterococcus]EGO6036649.1 RusA family crossover junction endodeoxyribonuclease [Enterococcus faecalis]EHE8520160.1 RusA family crossover junction endodeoxyribonuclease [Enterococcus faecalis]EHS8008460.1 RusA family crossover junction endodeoxyribonuclease [Enterococcus faecalis]EHU9644831.1 RusA family crossover junction endodeoxyribonuclease [Enterococcus faecalis]EIB6792979.1 RusA family crossover junction endodeoxyribon
MEEMRIILPIEPKPQSRPRFARRGNYVQTYEDRAMKEYKNQVKNYLRKSRAKLIEKGPISAHVTFYIHPPKSALSNKQKRLKVNMERMYCDKKPDLDNYFKAVTDAAEGILYKNDGQIAVMVCQKLYSMRPRTEIEIMSLEEKE